MTYTHTKSASDEYFNHKVLEKTSGMDDMQGVKWNLTLCNLFVWLLTFIVLSRGIKSLGKVWSDAAVQIFYSLGTCQGGLIAMASYNQFKNNTLRDSLLIPVINCLTSFYAGFVIFSVLGFMAHKKNTSVDQVVDEGPGLAFVVYPEALAQMPISPLWAVLFFIMMMTLGFSSLGGMYMLNLLDKSVGGFPLLVVGFVELLVIIYIYGISNRTHDTKAFPKIIFRGYLRLKSDIEMMLGRGIPVTIGFFYFAPTWCFIAPIALLVVIVLKALQWKPYTLDDYVYPDWATALSWLIVAFPIVVIVLKALQWKPYTLDDYVYPDWATALSWLIVAFPIVFIPAWILYYCACRDKRNLCHPKANWGPAFEENRTGLYSKDLNFFYQSPVASTVLENDGYQFVRKDTNEVNKTNIYQPYSDPPVMANFESRTDSSYDNKSYVHDVVESTKL
ncbi:unnamed protein product [Mytilus coruscus]|uniref:Uncharacterized protein n=1 Tax=Mytilus coruscus TaxID=42192 RepID=A0A6J8DET0_MYTCO|nr:unnamed protein product [Mytilus coruscus]